MSGHEVLFAEAPHVPGLLGIFRSTGIGQHRRAAAVLAPECGVVAGRPGRLVGPASDFWGLV